MGRELKRSVIIGEVVYRPGDTPTDEHAKMITNPRAWGEEDTDATQAAVSPGPTPTGTTAGIGGDPTPGDAVPAPPRSGPGSGEDKWRAWAASHPELEVEPDAKKADIIAAAEDAGLLDKQ
ncbi:MULTISPECIES: hypothetical protein [unclassified Micromonospora]|uniref:hypothetical protein n=1 Tax=unclassified Micromonospora TaxID=2617518 RepID=UPI00331D7E71